jgi:hypothetical protein
MKKQTMLQILTLAGVGLAFLTIFVGRTILARQTPMPDLSDLTLSLTLLASLVVIGFHRRQLLWTDALIAVVLGVVVGVGLVFTKFFSPYPFFGVVRDDAGQALVRGLATAIAALGGLTAMRLGGPVRLHAVAGEWRKAILGTLLGLGLGLPLAVVNVFALQMSEGQPVVWQSLGQALLDALQPALGEEIVYRFALLGVLWMIFRKPFPKAAAWLAALTALLVHNYAHFSLLFMEAPLVALGMGLVMGLIWGVPMTILALRKGLESATAFHWVQDVARFVAGF